MATDTTTTDTERCELTDLLTRECAHCRGHDDTSWLAQLRANLLTQKGWIKAVYPGRCVECGEPYAPGAAIHIRPGRAFADGTRRWMAECCAPEEVTDAIE